MQVKSPVDPGVNEQVRRRVGFENSRRQNIGVEFDPQGAAVLRALGGSRQCLFTDRGLNRVQRTNGVQCLPSRTGFDILCFKHLTSGMRPAWAW